jgi:hypothetical protein
MYEVKIYVDENILCSILKTSLGSMLEGLGKWIDHHPQLICKEIPYIFQSSYSVTERIRETMNISTLPNNTQLFTADATSMYTNIDTTHSLDVIKHF